MSSTTERNKKAVVRFNKEFIEAGNVNSFADLVSARLINHAAPPGTSTGPEGMMKSIMSSLRVGFPDIKVEIIQMIAEGNLVSARKIFHGTHSGVFMGIPPTGEKVAIHSIEVIKLEGGKYLERWGLSNINEVAKALSGK